MNEHRFYINYETDSWAVPLSDDEVLKEESDDVIYLELDADVSGIIETTITVRAADRESAEAILIGLLSPGWEVYHDFEGEKYD